MAKELHFSPFTGNVFERVAGRPLSQAGGLPPIREAAADTVQKGSIAPFDRIPVLNGGAGDKVSRPFEQSAWVMRAIKEIAGPISAVTLKFRDPVTEQEITHAPWMQFWKAPVRNLTLDDFVEANIGWLKLCGEVFVILQPEFTVPFPDVVTAWPQLLLARPDSMRAVKATDGELIGWEYSGPNGQRLKLSPDQVIQPKYWNPYDALRGLSEYEAARVATESDYLSGKFALNLSRANGNTGIIVGVKGGAVPTEEQQAQINSSLRQWQQKSQRGDFASIFVPADLEVQDPKVRSLDAQLVAQRLENRHEIYIALGVPPSMADVVASYSIGSASDWYRLITGTCMKDGKKVAGVISAVSSRMHGSPVEAYFDFDEHPVMQAVRRERIDAGTKLFDRGVPWKTTSEYLDLDLPTFKGDDQGYLPATLLPVDGSGAATLPPETSPAYSESGGDASSPVQEMFRALRGRARSPLRAAAGNGVPALPDCDCCSIDWSDLEIRERDAKEVKLWKSIVAGRRGAMRAYESKFTAALMVARREVLSKIEQHLEFGVSDASSQKGTATGASPLRRAAAADFLFNLANWQKLFSVQMRGVALDALQKAGDQVFAELQKDDPWKVPQAEAIQFLRARENKLSGVPGDVFERIKSAIEEGLNAGDPLKKIADRVRAEFNDIGKARGLVIAQTETAAAYGFGRDEAMKAAGVQWKRWLTSGNRNTRAAHVLMNGTIIKITDSFTVINPKTGETDVVKHPGDSSGAPWNVINCHCVEVASATGPEEIT